MHLTSRRVICLLAIAAFALFTLTAKRESTKLVISKETTYITQPLTKDGYPDYAGAINRRLGEGVTAENNANVLFWRAHGPHPEGATMDAAFFELMGIDPPPEEGDYFVDLVRYLKNQPENEPGDLDWDDFWDGFEELQTRVTSRPWKAKDYPSIAKWLKVNEKPLALVVAGAKRPKYFSPLVTKPGELISVLLPGVQANRQFARALIARAMLRVGEGRIEAAWADLLACHRLGRLVGRGSTLVESLVGIAIDRMAGEADLAFLQHTEPSAKQTAGYLRDLNSLPFARKIVEIADQGERFTYLDFILPFARDSRTAFKKLTGTTGIAGNLTYGNAHAIDWNIVMRMGNESYDRLIKAMQIEDRSKREKAFEKIDRDSYELAKSFQGSGLGGQLFFGLSMNRKQMSNYFGNLLVTLLIPSIEMAQNAEECAVQQRRNLRIAFALAGFHADHGRYPQQLQEIAPKYLKNLPSDLFSAKSMVIYRPSKDGYLLYSVGANGKDDQGRCRDDQPAGDDLRIRMPLPLP